MKTNQAFEILKTAGGVRAARIITEKMPRLSRLKAWQISQKLKRGVPVAKIVRRKWFYGIEFYTNKHTLDPRPDTETLVSAVIADVRGGAAPAILDLGCGTGCIIISLCKNIQGAHGVAIDISRGALRVARRNVTENKLTEKIRIQRGSFSRNLKFPTPFDVIVSNPPYIARGDSRVDVGATHDPARALYAASDGYAAYQDIAKNAKKWIKKGGKLYLEIGEGMGDKVKNIFLGAGWGYVRAENDLGGIERVLIFTPNDAIFPNP